MKTWYLTDKNGLETEYGQIKIVTELQALRSRIDAELQVVKGEVDDPNIGVDYFGIIFSNTPLMMKVQELTRVINQIPGVNSVEFDRAESDKKTQTLRFFFTIHSIYGRLSYDRTFDNAI